MADPNISASPNQLAGVLNGEKVLPSSTIVFRLLPCGSCIQRKLTFADKHLFGTILNITSARLP
jgi:hypothetical protein